MPYNKHFINVAWSEGQISPKRCRRSNNYLIFFFHFFFIFRDFFNPYGRCRSQLTYLPGMHIQADKDYSVYSTLY